MLIYENEYETKENKNWTKDKIELQHIYDLEFDEAIFQYVHAKKYNPSEVVLIFY